MPGVNVYPFDSTLMIREVAAGNLLATATLPANGKQVWGVVEDGMAVQVIIPAAVAATTLKVDVQLSTDDVTYNTVASNVGGAKLPAAGDVWVIPFAVPAGRYYVKVVFTVAGAGANFGTVTAGIIPNPGGEYDRAYHFL